MMERLELGVDGNCGYALLGEDIQSWEALPQPAEPGSLHLEDCPCHDPRTCEACRVERLECSNT